jgi:hypothetical protein
LRRKARCVDDTSNFQLFTSSPISIEFIQPSSFNHPHSTTPIQPPSFNHPHSTTPIQPPPFNHPHSTTPIQPPPFNHPHSTTLIQSLSFNHLYLIKLNLFEIIQKISIMITSFAEDVVPVLVSTRAKRIENAKQFLKDNLIEIIACAARIYDLIEITLYSSINRQKKENEDQKKRHESNNKILQQHEVDALYKLIKSLLMNDISSTHNLLFEVICFLKSKEESNLLTRR